MNVVVLHQHVPANASTDERDVLVQSDAVIESLTRLGHRATALSTTLDLGQLRRQLLALRPELVFNLVESLAGTDRLMPMVPMLLESMAIAFTGSSSSAIASSGDKLRVKAHIDSCFIPTPNWFAFNREFDATAKYIVKPIYEHASRGIDESSIVGPCDADTLRAAIARRDEALGVSHFAEQFIEGREFNISLIETDGRWTCLPVAEIDFGMLPPNQPHIVGQAAKWDEQSDEYRGTPRTFAATSHEEGMIHELQQMAEHCCVIFEIGGYARVDFRLDHRNEPYVLEINANPCLSPDAGFAAAVSEAGFTFDDAITKIVASGLTRHPRS